MVMAAGVWLLVQPPVLEDGTVALQAPLGSWSAMGRFPTSQACERQRSSNSAAILAGVGMAQDPGSRRARLVATSARCIDAATLVPKPTATP